MKIVNIQDAKHPASLYIYDSPGAITDIKEEAAVFPTVDIVLIVLNGDDDDQCSPRVVSQYSSYVSSCLAKYATLAAKQAAASDIKQEVSGSPIEKKPDMPSPLEEAAELNKKKNLDESSSAILHQLKVALDKDGTKYPKVIYVFTHRDTIEAKGLANIEAANAHREKLIKEGMITKNVYVVSCKTCTDIHLLFKNEIQLKFLADALYRT